MRTWKQEDDSGRLDLEALELANEVQSKRLKEARARNDIYTMVGSLQAMASNFNNLGDKKSAADYLACAIKEVEGSNLSDEAKRKMIENIKGQQRASKIPNAY